MRRLLATSLACAALAACAYSRIDPASVTWTQKKNGFVQVDYTLQDAPAFVTAQLYTNGVPVGAAEQAGLSGAINRIVRPGAKARMLCARMEMMPFAAARPMTEVCMQASIIAGNSVMMSMRSAASGLSAGA